MTDQAKTRDQIAMDEKIIDDEKLEASLEQREKRRKLLAGYRVEYQKADEEARGLLQALDFPEEGAIRIGRFRITRSTIPGRSVSFDTKPAARIRITAKDET